MILFFSILTKCEERGEKLLVFSEYLSTFDAIEYYLSKIKSWVLGKDYFRLDGQTDEKTRKDNCKEFNDEYSKQAR